MIKSAESFSEGVVGAGDVGGDPDGAVEKRNSVGGATGLEEQKAEEAEGIGIVWGCREDLAIELIGGGKLALLVEAGGLLEGLLDLGGGHLAMGRISAR